MQVVSTVWKTRASEMKLIRSAKVFLLWIEHDFIACRLNIVPSKAVFEILFCTYLSSSPSHSIPGDPDRILTEVLNTWLNKGWFSSSESLLYLLDRIYAAKTQ